MRTLTLNGQHGNVFKHLYFGFLQGGNNLTKEKKDRSTVRLEARIQTKFDAVIDDDPEDKALPWRLKPGEQQLQFTAEEYDHVDRCLDAVPWPTAAARPVAAMLDLWTDAERT